MPSINKLLTPERQVKVIGQKVTSVLPPLQKVAYNGDTAQTTALTVLKGEPNKIYLINAFVLDVANTGATACTWAAIRYTEYFKGQTLYITRRITPSIVVNEQMVMQNLNLALFPGTDVELVSDGANAPAVRSLSVFYTEVEI